MRVGSRPSASRRRPRAAAQRPQAEAHLQERRGDERQAEQQEGHRQREAEVAGYRRRSRRPAPATGDGEAPVLADIDLALEDAQQAVVRARRHSFRAVRRLFGAIAWSSSFGELAADQRARGADVRPARHRGG